MHCKFPFRIDLTGLGLGELLSCQSLQENTHEFFIERTQF